MEMAFSHSSSGRTDLRMGSLGAGFLELQPNKVSIMSSFNLQNNRIAFNLGFAPSVSSASSLPEELRLLSPSSEDFVTLFAEPAPWFGEQDCWFLVAEDEKTLVAGDPAFRGINCRSGGGGGGGGGGGVGWREVLDMFWGMLLVD